MFTPDFVGSDLTLYAPTADETNGGPGMEGRACARSCDRRGHFGRRLLGQYGSGHHPGAVADAGASERAAGLLDAQPAPAGRKACGGERRGRGQEDHTLEAVAARRDLQPSRREEPARLPDRRRPHRKPRDLRTAQARLQAYRGHGRRSRSRHDVPPRCRSSSVSPASISAFAEPTLAGHCGEDARGERRMGRGETYATQAGPHCAVGRIVYPDGARGVLVYFKSSVTGDEKDYILDYKRCNPSFPHETTTDEFFTEEQFEAYRALGFHIVDHFFGEAETISWAGGEDCFQSLEEALEAIDEALARGPTPARRSWEGRPRVPTAWTLRRTMRNSFRYDGGGITMALDANQLLGMSQAELDALFSAHEAGPIPDGEAAGHGDHRAGNPVQPRNRGGHQYLRLEGQGLRREGRIPAQRDPPLRPQSDRRAGLQGAELARRQGMHRPRLFRDLARCFARSGRDPARR